MNNPSEYLTAMRGTAPLVHNITNYVSMNIMANVMLAAGCSPAMVHAREEVIEFAGLAQVLTVNIGTLSTEWVAAMVDAAEAVSAAGKPWVFDPVAAGATEFRRDVSAGLVALKPTVVRGNASEILALSGALASGKGVDSADSVTAAEEGARELAAATGGVVAVTGAVDFVTDGARAWRVSNGDPIMPSVTALGCSLTGIVGAFIANQPAAEATVAALAYYALAGEQAAARAEGPGSFQMHFLDALYRMTPDALDAGARIETV